MDNGRNRTNRDNIGRAYGNFGRFCEKPSVHPRYSEQQKAILKQTSTAMKRTYQLKMCGQEIERVNWFKYLGIIIKCIGRIDSEIDEEKRKT